MESTVNKVTKRDVKKLTCNWCGSTFQNESNLNLHIKTAKYCLKLRGENIDIKKLKCQYCDSTFTQKITLECHYETCKKKSEILHSEEIIKLKKEFNEKMKKEKNDFSEKMKQEKSNFNKRISKEKQYFNRKMNEEREDFDKKLNEEKDEKDKMEIIIQNINKIMQSQDERIRELEKALAKEQGCVLGMEKAKPQTINNNGGNINTVYVNPKLAKINTDTIRPLTIEIVEEDIHKFTREEFFRGVRGLIDFILNLIVYPPPIQIGNVEEYSSEEDECTTKTSTTSAPKHTLIKPSVLLDERKQYNFVCTDSSRQSFHKLEKLKKWELNERAEFINTIFDALENCVTEYYSELLLEIQYYSEQLLQNSERIKKLDSCKDMQLKFKIEKDYDKKKEELKEKLDKYNSISNLVNDVYLGIIHKDGPRINLFNQVRCGIKKMVSV